MSEPVEKARAILAKLTPRPWRADWFHIGDRFERLEILTIPADPKEEPCAILGSCNCCESIYGRNVADAEFFFAAPAIVEQLCDEVERLETPSAVMPAEQTHVTVSLATLERLGIHLDPVPECFVKWNEARKGDMGDTFHHMLARLRDGAEPDSLNALTADALSALAKALGND